MLAQDGRIENSEYIRELVRFSENCMEEDIAVVYYSGHGGIDERGDNYLYATNTFDGNDMTCVYFDVIIEHLKKSKAKSKLVIIDCCHADSNYGSEKQKFDTDKAIKDIYQSGITDSDLKDYSKQSYDLAIDIQELLFLLNSDKGEEWAISNFKLKLIKYYRSMEAWKEATDKLE